MPHLRRLAAAFAVLLMVAFGSLAAAAVPAGAQTDTTVPDGPVDCGEFEGIVCQGWFTDDAGVVDDDQRVEDSIGRLVARYGNQIAFVFVEDAGEAHPTSWPQPSATPGE